MSHPSRQRERPSEDSVVETEQETDQVVDGCPECRTDNLVTSDDGGEIVCEDCGLVIEETNIDRGPEWRAFN